MMVWRWLFKRKPGCDMAYTELCAYYCAQHDNRCDHPECHYKATHWVRCLRNR